MDWIQLLQEADIFPGFCLRKHDAANHNEIIGRYYGNCEPGFSGTTIQTPDGSVDIHSQPVSLDEASKAVELEINFRVIKGILDGYSFCVDFTFRSWSKDYYVLFPGAEKQPVRFPSPVP